MYACAHVTKQTYWLDATVCCAIISVCLCMQLLLDGNSMHNNTASYGGAIGVWGNASVTVVGGILKTNSAMGGGAIDVAGNSSTTLQQVTLTNNSARQDAGGLYVGDSAKVRYGS
jgi:hypothetical protein